MRPRGRVEVIYDDDDIAVVSKPAGMLVHPAPGNGAPTMVDILLEEFPCMRGVGGRDHDGVVHRLDRETSGVMVFAKNAKAYLALRREFESHADVGKKYLAVLDGTPREKTGTVDNVLFKSGSKMRVSPSGEGLRAVTHWEVLARRNGRSLVEFRIETGRMHQIRVHAAFLGCPVSGDRLYGDKAADMRYRPPRLLLHAVSLAFRHPATGERVEFAALPPPEILRF